MQKSRISRIRVMRLVTAASICLMNTPVLAADFTSPTLGSFLNNPRDLQAENIRILAETPLPNGQTLLEVATDLRNLDDGTWNGVMIGPKLESIQAGLVNALDTTMTLGDLAAGGIAIGNTELHVVVDVGQLQAARSEILAGTILSAAGRTLTGTIVGGTQLLVEGVQIVQEVTLASGKVLLLFTANVRNLLQETVTGVVVNVVTSSGTVPYSLALSGLAFTNVAAGTYNLSPDPGAFHVTVDAADLSAVRADLLDGDLLSVTGTELFVFNAPPRGIDGATESAWLPPASTGPLGEVTLVFDADNPFLSSLQPGDLLVEDPGVNRLITPDIDNPFNPNDDHPPKVLADYLPLEVTGVTTGLGNQILVTGQQKKLLEVVKSATFFQDSKTSPYDNPARDPYDPVLENTYTADEEEDREELAEIIADANPRDGRLADLRGMTSKPIVLNKKEIIDGGTVSGEIFLRSSGLQLEVKIRNFQLERAIAHIDAGVIANLLIEVEKPVDTTGLKEEEKKKHLKNLPLPGVTFNIGGVPVKIAPLFFVDAGIDANVPQSLTLPLQSAFIIGIDMGYDRSLVSEVNDGFFYEPVTEFIPLRVSDPTVFDDLAVSVGAWAELGISIIGSIVPIPDAPGPGEPSPLALGPTLAARAKANFTVAPLADPWWNLDFDVELIGRFSARILGETIVDAEASLHTYELEQFDRNAGGPLIDLTGMRPRSPSNAGIKPLSAKDVRWSRAFQPRSSYSGFNQAFTFFLPEPEDEFLIAGGSITSGSAIAKFTQEGDVVWMKDMGNDALAMYGAPLDASTFVVVGKWGNSVVLSKFDTDGNRLWHRSYAPANLSFLLKDLAVLSDPGGAPTAIIAVGYINQGTVRESDPWVIKFDLSGNVLWSRYYALPEDDQIHSVFIPDSGSILLGGFTEANVAAPGMGTPASDNVLKNATSSGLLMKLDAEDGSVDWSHAYASRWGMIFEDVLQAPDGTIYAGGACSRIVTQTRPVNLFAKLDADGMLLDHVLVGDDPDTEDLLPTGGNSPYDTVARMVWTDEGLLACGTTGLGTARSGWVMGLTDELGVKFFSIFDGNADEVFLDLAAGNSGMGIVGWSRSVYPWGGSGQSIPVLMKLPWEGLMRFHPDTRINTLMLPPQVYHSSSSSEFKMLSTMEIQGTPQTLSNQQSPVIFTPTALAMNAGSTNVPVPEEATATVLLALEAVEPAVIQNYEGWATYHNLLGDSAGRNADDDGDGLLNIFEAFFGRNPHVAETEPVLKISSGEVNGQPVAVLEFNRTTFSQSFGIHFEESANLKTWFETTGLAEHVQPLNSSMQYVQLLAPQDIPCKFYRVAAELAGAASSGAKSR